MLSIWEQLSFLEQEYIIIGSGIVGLSTAISIKEKVPSAQVLILERGILPTGASTKNAGFACFGSLSEILHDVQIMGEVTALSLVQDRKMGLVKLRERLGDARIDFQNLGGFELLREHELHYLENLESVNSALFPLFKNTVFYEKRSLIDEFGFSKRNIKSMIYNPFEGQIDTGKMMLSLLALASSLGVKIYTGAEVLKFHEESECVKIEVASPYYKSSILFKTSALAICTNAFTKTLLPDLNINPGRGLVLATTPIPDLKFKGVFHMEEGYYYFRNFQNRIILGGGRNLSFIRETSTEFEVNEEILENLKKHLFDTIIPETKCEVEHIWTGIMAFGENKKPIVKLISNKIAVGARLGGMGVAIGSNLGDQLASLLLKLRS